MAYINALFPNAPGLYMVELRNTEPMPVDDDPRRPNCLKVTLANIKFGKATLLRRRASNYRRIFKGHDTFLPLVLVDEIGLAEGLVKQELDKLKCRIYHNRRPHEWLHSTTLDQLRAVVLTCLLENGFTYDEPTETVPCPQMLSPAASNQSICTSSTAVPPVLRRTTYDTKMLGLGEAKPVDPLLMEKIEETLKSSAMADQPSSTVALLELWEKLGREHVKLFKNLHPKAGALTTHLNFCRAVEAATNKFTGITNLLVLRKTRLALQYFVSAETYDSQILSESIARAKAMVGE